MRLDRFQIIGLAQNGQQYGIGDKIKAREHASLVVKVTNEGFEADFQLDVDVT